MVAPGHRRKAVLKETMPMTAERRKSTVTTKITLAQIEREIAAAHRVIEGKLRLLEQLRLRGREILKGLHR